MLCSIHTARWSVASAFLFANHPTLWPVRRALMEHRPVSSSPSELLLDRTSYSSPGPGPGTFPSFLSGQLSLIDEGLPAKRRMMILASADPAFVFEYLALVGN